MHHAASSPREDKWGGRSQNKQDVNMSANALKPLADAYPWTPQSLQEENDAIVEPIDAGRVFFTASPAMHDVRRQIEQVAAINAPVLLVGESGTGKELVARLIHKRSARASHDFLKVNCAALPAEPLESELFGHNAGAFPGATSARPGKFEAADSGTLLLEDIGGIPMSSQPRLLHAMQEGEFARLGAPSTMHCDVRVIATTDMDLRQAVLDGAIRSDLYYCLNGFTIHIPPLRQHMEDLPYLLNHFMNAWSAEYKCPRLPLTRQFLIPARRTPGPVTSANSRTSSNVTWCLAMKILPSINSRSSSNR